MTDSQLIESAPEPPKPPRPRLVSVDWPLSTAFTIIVVVILTSLAAGLLVALTRRLSVASPLQALATGVILSSSYVVQMAIVARAARTYGSAFVPAVGLRSVKDPGAYLLGAIGVAVLARFAAGWYAIILQALNVQLPGQNVDISRLLPGGFLGWSAAFLLLVVVAPFAEEVVFRGVLLSSMRDRWGDWPAILGSSAVFAAVHVNPYVALPIFGLAIGLGFLFVRSRSLWISMACHATFNAIGFIALVFSQAAR